MCRLLCYMGQAIPMDLLITKPENSLVFQARDASFHPGCPDKRNIRVNGDGFGIAWYNPKKIAEGACVVKFPTPAWSSANLLNIATFVESGLVFAHVRAASDGSALVGNVNHENTHPFKFKRYTFMHNGGIPGFDKMKRQLLSLVGDEAYEAIDGTTDSEVCFAFFLDELPNTDEQLDAAEIAQVVRRTIARIVSAVARFAEPRSPDRGTATATAAAAVAAATAAAAAATATAATSAATPPTTTTTAAAAAAAAAAEVTATGGVGTNERVPPPSSSSSLPPIIGSSDGSIPTVDAVATAAAAAAAAATTAAPPMSLNFCVTDGRHIVCSRYRNHHRQDPPSLFVLSGAGFACDEEGSCLRLTAKEPQTSVVISSEPLCRSTKSWRLLPRNSMVVIEGTAPTAATENGDDVAGDAPRLVASIKYEPLRCHPSDVSSIGNGNGVGNGSGSGSGNGNSNGIENGGGFANGIGNGIGNGNGKGTESGTWNGFGYGIGNGFDIGNGSGSGNGNGPTSTSPQGSTPGESASCGSSRGGDTGGSGKERDGMRGGSPDAQQGGSVSLDGAGSTAAPCSSVAVAAAQLG